VRYGGVVSRVLQIMRELEPAVDDADGLYLIQYENGTHERVTTSDLQILLANGDSRRQARLAYDTDLCQVCLRADYGEGHWAHRVTPPRTLLVVTDPLPPRCLCLPPPPAFITTFTRRCACGALAQTTASCCVTIRTATLGTTRSAWTRR
jgi:hypothetical protein